MGLLTDILKEIPQAAVLKEKITTIEAKYAAADTENAILKDDLRQARMLIEKLKQQVKELTHKDDITADEIDVLKTMADMGVDLFAIERIHTQFNMTAPRLQYLVGKLRDANYVCVAYGDNWGNHYKPTQKGLELLAQKNLI